MALVPFIKNEKLLEYLDIELRKALESRCVYPLASYAWLDEDTPNDAYIGLAKWELESPEWTISLHGNALSEIEKTRLISMEIAGEDLRGLMEMSRVSIGHAIFYSELAKKSPFELHDPFWIHHLNAMTMLNMASDRLRDIFLLGVFKQTAKEYKRGKHNDAKHYDYPFSDAMTLPFVSQFKGELLALIDLAKNIYDEGINKRNDMVHELATALGRLAKATAGKNIDPFKQGREHSYDELRKAWDESNQRHENEIEGAVQSLVAWYERLVQATALVCDIEHTIRRDGLLNQ